MQDARTSPLHRLPSCNPVGKKTDTRNLLELKPLRNLQWEEGENDQVVLLVPKFTNRWMRTWVLPRLGKPHFRVKTDAFGSFVWKKCDGTSTVLAIGEEMNASFGSEFDPTYERVSKFIQQLVKNEFVVLKE
jgi:hypothetical protein